MKYNSVFENIIKFNQNKNKILYFHENMNIIINSEYNNFVHYVYIDDNIYYDGYNISQYRTNYNYIFYINNFSMVDFNDINFNDLEAIFNNNNKISQILLSDIKMENKIIKYNFEDEYDIFELIKPIFTKNIINPYIKKNTTTPNLINYMNKQYDEFYNFKLLTCVLDIRKIQDYFCVVPKSIGERMTKIYQKDNNYETFFYNINIEENLQNNNILDEQKILNKDDITLVTGYIFINKKSLKKQKYDYLEHAIETLKIPKYMVIYVSQEYYSFVLNIREKFNLSNKTKIITITENDLYMFEKIDKIKKNCEKNIAPYNNPYQIIAVNSRYNYVQKSMENNFFNTRYFAWIDFSINHIVRIPPRILLNILVIN
jgi:hypothetical protein